LVPVAGLPQELRQRFIPVLSIAFGTPATVDEALLRNVSLETAGRSYISVNATTIFNTFALTLVGILKGNTASLALQRTGALNGTGPTAAEPLLVDPSAQRVVFSLQWAPPQRDLLALDVTGPGGTPATPASAEQHPQSDIRSFDIRPTDLGAWSVRVRRNPHGDANPNVPVPYTLNVFFLEKHLDYRLAFETVRTGTGDSIGLRATVSYDGKPLTKLPAGAIRVRIQRPTEGLGNILHDSRIAVGSGNTTTPSGDILTPYDRKVGQLTDRALLDRILPRDVATVVLTEEGNGVYRGVFDNTSVPGTYGFDVVLDWDDPRTGHLRREERLEQLVAVKPDAGRTEVLTTRTGPNTVLISVTPRDRFGNWVGPGYGSTIAARVNRGGTLVPGEPVDRDQTGTYVFTVNDVPDGVTPDVDVTIRGGAADNPITVHTGGGGPSNPAGTAGAWRVFIDAGPNFPHGGFSNGVDGRWSLNAGVERRLSSLWSFEAIAGQHRFKAPFISNPHIWQLSAGGKRFFGTSPFRPFVNAAVGTYRLDPGHATKGGANAGAGVLFELSPCFGIEGAWNYHWIRTTPNHVSFSALQLGVRFSL
ncbi:MAG: von Willebrand factor type domain protein, partial [Acidobacteria bacterium]|nr:von Willebrand factor type domain protein [Acidobacteriota bacterium]